MLAIVITITIIIYYYYYYYYGYLTMGHQYIFKKSRLIL